ncbi:2'-5' RNA ligase family protein [Nocardia puris]|uniref:2'-5' RNA ligase family protein n=1 Tax=Nocardia puris TaxID=208602 RepID=UPI00147600AE|nr:2'-5' RNA ligase family protein [Nocardia puris]
MTGPLDITDLHVPVTVAGVEDGSVGGTAFPPERPTSLTDAETIRTNDWQAFQRLPRLDDHWTRKVWEPDYAAYYWYLTFTDPALVRLVEQCRSRLDATHLNLVPAEGLHLTVVKVGAAEDITASEMEAVVATAAEQLAEVDAFSLDVGPLAGSPSAIRFSVTPWDRLVDLHARLTASLATVRPEFRPKPTSRFRPHLGIAYNKTPRDATPVIREIAALRDLPPATVLVDAVQLVRLWRTDHGYEWDECAVISLRP